MCILQTPHKVFINRVFILTILFFPKYNTDNHVKLIFYNIICDGYLQFFHRFNVRKGGYIQLFKQRFCSDHFTVTVLPQYVETLNLASLKI